MRRSAVLLAALLSVAAPAAADWTQKTVERFGFSAGFPVEPSLEESVEGGVKLATYMAAAPGVMCLLVIGDYPAIPSVDAELDASRDNFLKGVSAKLTASKRASFYRGTTELPGLVFDAASDEFNFHSIIVVDKLRVYITLGGVPKKNGSQDDIDRCVGSFKLTP